MARSPRRPSRKIQTTIDSVFLHDMKNLGFRLSLLLANLQEHYGDPDFQRSAVELLQSTVDRVDAVVRRSVAHQDNFLIKVELDLNDLLREAARDARSRDGSRDGRSAIKLDLEPLPPVWGDPIYLKEAFLSVLQNGLEAGGARGSVGVRTSLVSGARRTFASVEIDDDGPGIPSEFRRHRLFRPFQTTKVGGVGLGLYAAREILRHHAGRIAALEAPGGGARFRILLPAETSGS
jgi:signal transduction histidine kinase